MRKISTLLLLALVSVSMRAQTVVDIVVGSPDHNTLETAVIEAGLAGTLSGPGPFTVFAPTDAAFAALPAGTLEALLADPSGDLTQILLYHVVGETIFAGDLSDGAIVTTLQGSTATISLNGGAFINDAQIIVTDIVADNGIVHVIDAVLLPPPSMSTTIFDIISDSPEHNTLQAAIEAAGLAETLTTGGPFTVFAPNDNAFALLPEGVLQSLLEDPSGALTEILFYHVVEGSVLSTDLFDGQMVMTLNGEEVTVTITEDGVFINDALVQVVDIMADNGIVHVIDAVLLPGGGELPTILDIVANSEVHTILEAAVLAAGLDMDLSMGGPLTLFAPTDDAFNALPAGTIEALLADPTGLLTEILLYHVVDGAAYSNDLSDGQMITTLNGASVTVEIIDGSVFINGAQVIIADIEASNGVVHVIDAVLVPAEETNTVVDIIVNSDVHNTLEAAVVAADLVGTLSGPGPFTVFAPTDAAFEALPAGVLDAVLADTDLLTEILFYHVVGGVALSTDLSDGQEVVTLQGQTVTITIVDGNVFINDAQVIIADIMADNGVVHVIDAVLVPTAPEETTVWDIIVNSEDHTTLEAAVLAAGLDADLDAPGSITVFAPTDAAFNALPAGTIEALLADPTGLLTEILLYHVVGSAALSTDLSDGQTITTLNGADVTVSIVDGNVFINDAQVIIADIVTDNGVVHVIDAVLVPTTEEPFTVWDVIVNSADHTVLELAVGAAGLDNALDNADASLTVFAPTDAAFAALPAGTIEALLANPAGLLTTILTYHVVSSVALSTDLSDGQTITTLQGEDVTVTFDGGNVFINEAQVIVADIITDNGVVHVIDAVLLPPSNVNETSVSNLSVYPNPANNILNVSFTGTDRAMFEVVSVTGARVMEGMLNEWNNQLNVSALQNGIYTIRLINGNDVKVSTFMKQ